jgi:hypothetical protein
VCLFSFYTVAKAKEKKRKRSDTVVHTPTNALNLNDSFGPLFLEYDTSKLRSWALFGTPGAYTPGHGDPAGLTTYVVCKKGVKLWGFLLPSKADMTNQEYMRFYRDMAKNSQKYKSISALATPSNVLLTPGTIL